MAVLVRGLSKVNLASFAPKSINVGNVDNATEVVRYKLRFMPIILEVLVRGPSKVSMSSFVSKLLNVAYVVDATEFVR